MNITIRIVAAEPLNPEPVDKLKDWIARKLSTLFWPMLAVQGMEISVGADVELCGRFVDGNPHGKRCTLPAGHDTHA